MPPRLRFVTPNPLCSRSRLTLGFSILTPKTPSRYVTADEKPLSASEQPKGPNQDQLPHVSEEAAEIGKSTGEGGPELEQGTPVQEILKRDEESQKKAPEVLKDEMKSTDSASSASSSKPTGTRSFSTSTRRRAEELEAMRSQSFEQTAENIISQAGPEPLHQLKPNMALRRMRGIHRQLKKLDRETNSIRALLGLEPLVPKPEDNPKNKSFKTIDAAYLNALKSMTPNGVLPIDATKSNDPSTNGLKFEMPTLAREMRLDVDGEYVERLSRRNKFKERYDPVVDQMTKLIMKHGKLSLAQRHMSTILTHLRTSPPPKPPPTLPLRLPPGVTPSSLPLSPTLYLTVIIDSIAPLLKIRQRRGILGGGASLPIPVPLSERNRRRIAIKWVLDAAERRKEVSCGERVAKVLVDAIEGRSQAVWDKRNTVHRMGVAGRSNMRYLGTSRMRKAATKK